METTIGFIILRHINNIKTSWYWKLCYESIRNFYPENKIIIIDDNSDYSFIDTTYEKTLFNTDIIKSRFTKRGEYLPYLYYYKYKFFDIGIILHDSCFINCKFNFHDNENFKMLWDFNHTWDQPQDEINMILNLVNNIELLDFYNQKELWNGCFGAMSIIRYSFLAEITEKYNLTNLVNHINNRYNRMSFERIIGCIMQKENSLFCNYFASIPIFPEKGICGNITEYKQSYSDYLKKYIRINKKPEIYFKECINDMKNNNFPIIKIFSGR